MTTPADLPDSADETTATLPAGGPARTWSCVLFDLDGTLTDSGPGVISRLRDVIAELGYPAPSDATMTRLVGPPLLDSFRTIIEMTEEDARAAVVVNRRITEERGPWDGAAVFPGITGLLAELQAADIPLALATSKTEYAAIGVIEHFGLDGYFTAVTGAAEDESRSAKSEVVAETISRLTAAGADVSRPIMVGDRFYDVEGAAANGIPSILVEWGYGSPAEAAGTLAVVHSVDQLRQLLLGG